MTFKPSLLLFLLPLLLALPMLSGCDTCGFDCNDDDDNDNEPAIISIGLSDSLPEDLKEVVIELDSIVLGRDDPNEADVVIDTFTVEDLDAVDATTIQVNLLNYRGVNQLVVVEDLEIEADFYDSVTLNLVINDANNSRVVEQATDLPKILTAQNDALTISGRQIFSGETALTIEFELARALEYLAANDTYRLNTDGIRLVDTDLSAQIRGQVDPDLFDMETACAEKDEPLVGNRLYLYSGSGLDGDNLADVYNENSETSTSKAAPFAVATLALNPLTGSWEYSFGYLPEGDYTLAFSCDTEEDDTVDYDSLTIPLPSDQVYSISLSQAERFECNLNVEDIEC